MRILKSKISQRYSVSKVLFLRFDYAYIDASEAVRINPENWVALYHKASNLARLGFFEKARECYQVMLAAAKDGKSEKIELKLKEIERKVGSFLFEK